jgi:hypothetical protein
MDLLHILMEQPKDYDRLVHAPGGLPQASPVVIATKSDCEQDGLPGAVISFEVMLPDGTHARAQATVTVRLLQFMGRALLARYGQL